MAGDFGQTDSSTGAVLNAVKSSGTNMMFGIGDFSYVAGNSEPSWCSYVSSRVGATYPFELLAGNHESYPRDGYYKNYRTCLPDRLGVTGSYAQEYYVDYPAAAPLVRFVMISPNLQYDSSSATAWSYKSGTAHYTWTKNAIEGGKAKGLWVVAGMHEYCTSMVNYPCVVGADIMNLMLQEKVDLLFQAHDHAYARTKQLTVSPPAARPSPRRATTPTVSPTRAPPATPRARGPSSSTVGTGGKNMNAESPTVPQAPYFQTYEGNNQNADVGVRQGRRVTGAAVGPVRPGGRWHLRRRLHRHQPLSGAADHDHDDDHVAADHLDHDDEHHNHHRRPPRRHRPGRRPWPRWPTPGSAVTRRRPHTGPTRRCTR